jgi:hypothetical protein
MSVIFWYLVVRFAVAVAVDAIDAIIQLLLNY